MLSLSLIATITNAAYTTIAPILPLEIDKYEISYRWVSLIFLAFSIGSSVAPPLVARQLESVGTVRVMVYSMGGMAFLLGCLGYLFDIVGALITIDDDGHHRQGVIVTLLTVILFFMGAFFSSITTGYYSLVSLVFVEKESAMSSIEAAVGTGYVLGPFFGSILYEEMGYQHAYAFISLGMMVMALVTWKYLSFYLKYKPPEGVSFDDDKSSDLEAQHDGFAHDNSLELNRDSTDGRENIEKQLLNANTQQQRVVPQPSTISLLKCPKLLISAATIMWINVSWTCIEPLLAKRLDDFHVGKKQIGMVFSLANIIYVPTVFLAQYLPRHYTLRRQHGIISLSTMLTPIVVLLIGSNSFPSVILGIALQGLLPSPVWIMLLPFMQEQSAVLFPHPTMKRRVNDLTAGMYNSFMVLGQVVGYIIGPLMMVGSEKQHGFARMTQIVALMIFLQSLMFYFGTKGYTLRKKDATSSYSF